MPPLEPLFFVSAFFAGILMFLAPCTLPLLPAYLGFISGVTEKETQDEETRKKARRHVFYNSVYFTLGFSLVVITTGVATSYVGGIFSNVFGNVFTIFGGVLIVLFGLILLGVFKLSIFTKERRIQPPKWTTVGTPVSSMLLGGAFAIGWTPCLGPVYGTILVFASNTGTVFVGLVLLAIFALGFSLPFIVFAALISQSVYIIEKITPFLKIISVLGGFALIIIGLALIFGDTQLTNWFFALFDYLDFERLLMPYL